MVTNYQIFNLKSWILPFWPIHMVSKLSPYLLIALFLNKVDKTHGSRLVLYKYKIKVPIPLAIICQNDKASVLEKNFWGFLEHEKGNEIFLSPISTEGYMCVLRKIILVTALYPMNRLMGSIWVAPYVRIHRLRETSTCSHKFPQF